MTAAWAGKVATSTGAISAKAATPRCKRDRGTGQLIVGNPQWKKVTRKRLHKENCTDQQSFNWRLLRKVNVTWRRLSILFPDQSSGDARRGRL
jgi:hypothetical protein